jgi:hypothetical protein
MLLRKPRNSEPGQPALTAVRLSVLGAREQRKNFTYLKYLPALNLSECSSNSDFSVIYHFNQLA